jgi:endonuclease YncB( thermonuclease family)
MFDLVGLEEVACEVYGRDRFERPLAICRRASDGLDLNREIVRRGWALAWYPARGAILGPDYSGAEEEARQARRGLWRGTFIEPWVWRRGER